MVDNVYGGNNNIDAEADADVETVVDVSRVFLVPAAGSLETETNRQLPLKNQNCAKFFCSFFCRKFGGSVENLDTAGSQVAGPHKSYNGRKIKSKW